jgi:hypothetical protein
LSAAPKSRRKPTLDAIDFAVREVGITSFADLDMGATYGEHALYAMDHPSVRAGVLADARPARARAQLLNMMEYAAERPGLRVIDGDALDRHTIDEIGDVDAVFLFNVLHRAVAPDWDRVLEVYANLTSCFVIGSPQWRGGADTIRLIDLGCGGYLEAVPNNTPNRELFERLDEWSLREQRPQRDTRGAWQWGITDAGLKRKLEELGFELDFERSLGRLPGAQAFENKTFVFSRQDRLLAGNDARAQIEELRSSLATAEHERDELRGRVADLEQTLEDVLESSSWKLTAPLRASKRPFRRNR